MIELTLEQLINSIDALKQLSIEPLRASVAFTVARIIKAADTEVINFNDTRSTLINKYGKRNDDGSLVTDSNGNFQINREDVITFNTELTDLLSTSVTLNANKIKMDDIDNIAFTPAEMLTLEPYIEE